MDNVLQTLIVLEAEYLQSIGTTWIHQGVYTFSICDLKGMVLLCVQSEQAASEGFITHNIPLNFQNQAVGYVQIQLASQSNDEALIKRLTNDARIIERFMVLETELDSMTEAFVETQDQLLAFYTLGRSLGSEIDLINILDILVEEIARIIKMASIFILIEINNSIHIAQYPKTYTKPARLTYIFNIIKGTKKEYIQQQEHHHIISIPILAQSGDFLAVLGVVKADSPFLSPELKMGRAMSQQAAIYIERVHYHEDALRQERLQTEINMAADIQNQLLPQSRPQVRGLDVYSRLVQAQQVGGDFYDFIDTPNQHFAFIVGDVSGKGFSAAMMMAMTRIVMRAHANWLTNPEDVLNYSNADLYQDYSRVTMFTTAFVGYFDVATAELAYACGGHSPVIYCPAGQRARLLRPLDFPMGIVPDHHYQKEVLHLQTGDVLIVATDGFNEARNAHGDLFGFERLLALVTNSAQYDAQKIVEVICDTIDTFSSGRSQDDDQTIVVIKKV